MDEEPTMKVLIVPLAIFVGACATMQAGRPEIAQITP
jgi:hypothetical protein